MRPKTEPNRVQLRYGKESMTLRVPGSAHVLQGCPVPRLDDPRSTVRQALRQPIAAAPLKRIVDATKPQSVAITISDITRPAPNEPIVNALLDELNSSDVRDDQVVIIIATGMHRPSTSEERDLMLGRPIQRRCEVIDHKADRPDQLVRVCDDPPVAVNRRYVEAHLKIVTGLIEPHFMAGFSGGCKGVCPALVDLQTVQRFHGSKLMGDPRCTEGVLDNNPCQAESRRITKLVGADFLLNVANTTDRRLAGVYAGDIVEAHRVGCRQVAGWCSAEVDRPFDLVITSSGGYPLDQTFYQSVKGMVTALPALRDGGTLLIVSACHQIGSPQYTDLMMRFGRDHEAFLARISEGQDTQKDQWQYQMQTRVLRRIGTAGLRFANDGLPIDVQPKLAVNPLVGEGAAAQRAQRFIDQYLDARPSARVAVIPEGPYTMLHRAAEGMTAAGLGHRP